MGCRGSNRRGGLAMLWQTGRYCGRIVAIGLALGATTAARAGEVRFTLTNPAPQPVATVARVSLPVPPGALPPQPPARVLLGGKPLPAQARVITRHPDSAPARHARLPREPGRRKVGRGPPGSALPSARWARHTCHRPLAGGESTASNCAAPMARSNRHRSVWRKPRKSLHAGHRIWTVFHLAAV